MKKMVQGIILSLQFLTRFPLPFACEISPQTLRWALRFFPFAGLAIGGFFVLIGWLLQPYVPAGLLVLVLLTTWVYATGGLHLDGIMDVADAVGSNAPLERKYEIMKDSRVGSFAVIALIFLLLWKAALLYELVSSMHTGMWMGLLCIPVLSRYQALIQLYFFPPIQNKGLAYAWRKHLTMGDLSVAFIWVIVISFIYMPLIWLIPLQFLFSFVYGKWAMKHFKGMNGDLVGTSIEGAELWNLLVLYILLSFVMG